MSGHDIGVRDAAKLEQIRELVERTGFVTGCWGDRCTGDCDQCRASDFYHRVAEIVGADPYGSPKR